MTLRAEDAPGYIADLIRTAEHHLEQAHGLLDAAEQIMKKMADGEKISL
jgi:hypothetical protein